MCQNTSASRMWSGDIERCGMLYSRKYCGNRKWINRCECRHDWTLSDEMYKSCICVTESQIEKLCELSGYVNLHLLLWEKPIFFVCVRISKIVTELYLWWLKQYSSYSVLESLFCVRYQNIAPLLEMACRAIADKVYPTCCVFRTRPRHRLSMRTTVPWSLNVLVRSTSTEKLFW